MPLAGSKISRIELHRTGIKLADLVLLLDLYNVADVHREGGIGGAICRRLARDGFAVACFDLRGDLSADELVFLLGSLLLAAARMAAERQVGVEKAAALVTSVFLHGTENRKNAAVDATRS